MKAFASTTLSLIAIFGAVSAVAIVDPMTPLTEADLAAIGGETAAKLQGALAATGSTTESSAAAAVAPAAAATAASAGAHRGPFSAASPLISPTAAAAVAAGMTAGAAVRTVSAAADVYGSAAKRVDPVVAPVARSKPKTPHAAPAVATQVVTTVSPVKEVPSDKSAPATRVAGKSFEKPYALGAAGVKAPEPTTQQDTVRKPGQCGAGESFNAKSKSCVKAATVSKASPVKTLPN